MNRKVFTTTMGSGFTILILYFVITLGGEINYNNNISDRAEIFAQELNKPPVVKNSKVIEFSGINYAEVVNSTGINMNSFTVSAWFNTSMNVTGRDVAFLINKGGMGTELPGFNLNYGIWINNREQVTGGFETSIGDDYFLTSPRSYADGMWHNAILTYDEKLHMLKLYMEGLEVATNTTNIGITPDNTGKQPIRLGANSFTDRGQINGNFTGQLDDIQIWDYVFTKEQIASLFDAESEIPR